MFDSCYNSFMRKSRGLALVSSMFLAMTVLFMVTVMFATQRMDFRATQLSGEKLARQYQARAACAEVVIDMTRSSQWQQHVNGDPILMGYKPEVSVYVTTDGLYSHLIHLRAVCDGEEAFRVLRDGSQADAMLYTTAADERTNEVSFYSMSRKETRSMGRENPWTPLVAPPSVVYDANGLLTPVRLAPTKNYVADFRGNFYSIASGDEGFALYQYRGGDGWDRLPARPSVNFSTNGSTQLNSKHVGTDNEFVIADAHKDGNALCFVENIPVGPGLPNGASYIQTYDTEEKTWSVQDLPPQSVVGGDGRYQVKDIALGDSGQAFLLTKPTRSAPSQVMSLNDGVWAPVNLPKENYYAPDGSRVQTNQTMTADSITVDSHGDLLVSSPTSSARWYAVSKLKSGQWSMALDHPNQMSDLTMRNFEESYGFQSISVDSGDLITAGNKVSASLGRGDLGWSTLSAPWGTSLGSMTSRVGGGIRAESGSPYVTTAEY